MRDRHCLARYPATGEGHNISNLALLERRKRSSQVLTRTNSTGAGSPEDRDADTLVAGYAFGTMFTEARRFELVMTAEEIDTVRGGQHCRAHLIE